MMTPAPPKYVDLLQAPEMTTLKDLLYLCPRYVKYCSMPDDSAAIRTHEISAKVKMIMPTL